jgi:hypothetical protein
MRHTGQRHEKLPEPESRFAFNCGKYQLPTLSRLEVTATAATARGRSSFVMRTSNGLSSASHSSSRRERTQPDPLGGSTTQIAPVQKPVSRNVLASFEALVAILRYDKKSEKPLIRRPIENHKAKVGCLRISRRVSDPAKRLSYTTCLIMITRGNGRTVTVVP